MENRYLQQIACYLDLIYFIHFDHPQLGSHVVGDLVLIYLTLKCDVVLLRQFVRLSHLGTERWIVPFGLGE